MEVLESPSLKERNKHARDNHIVFDEAPHVYYVYNKAVSTSVTTLVHHFFEPFDSDTIIDKMMNSPYWFRNKYFGMTKDEIKEQWKQNGLEATTFGTHMHKTIEQYYNGWSLEFPNTPEFEQFMNFARDHDNKLIPYRTEWEIYDEFHDLAGSIDMVFQNVDDGSYSIYDWKRSKEIKLNNAYRKKGMGIMSEYDDCNYVHYSMQLNVYKNILERLYGLTIRDLFLVVCHPNAESYKKYECLDLQREVTDLLAQRKRKLLEMVDS